MANDKQMTINGFPEDIYMAIGAAMDNLVWSGRDPDQDDEPYHYILVREDRSCVMGHTVELDKNHQVGRILDALTIGEETIGKPFPPDLEASLTRLLFESFDYPDHLNRFVHPENGPMMHTHNLREGLLGLYALVKYRNHEAAGVKAGHMLRTLRAITTDDGRLSSELATEKGVNSGYENNGAIELAPPQSTGRLVGALMKYYRASGDPLALHLANLYAEDNLRRAFPPGGRLQEGSGTHVHSITSAMMGLLDWAVATDNRAAIEQLKHQFDEGFSGISTSYGWYKEERVVNEQKDRGENTGDMIQAALHLASAGYREYYEIAERHMRSFLLPGQLRSTADYPEYPDATVDRLRHIRRRLHGGYGFPTPNDRFAPSSFTYKEGVLATDVTAGAVTAMCLFLKHLCTVDEEVRVNLLFSMDHADVQVVSSLPHKGLLELKIKSAKPILVRMPQGLTADQIAVVVDQVAVPAKLQDHYVWLGNLSPGTRVTIAFPLPERTTVETLWNGETVTASWRGSQVWSVTPVGAYSPMFQASLPPTQAWGTVHCAATGQPIEQAEVVIRGSGDEALGTAFTDAGGLYAIDTDQVITGQYRLTVRKEGFRPFISEPARMIGGWPLTLNLVIQPE